MISEPYDRTYLIRATNTLGRLLQEGHDDPLIGGAQRANLELALRILEGACVRAKRIPDTRGLTEDQVRRQGILIENDRA